MTHRGCHAAIAARDTCAVIPARKTARPWLENTPGALARNDTVRATRRLGRTIWRRWCGYHRRSLVETRMRCLRRLGPSASWRFAGRARTGGTFRLTFDRQVAELQIGAFAGSLEPMAFTRSP